VRNAPQIYSVVKLATQGRIYHDCLILW